MAKRTDKNKRMSGKTYISYQKNKDMKVSYCIPRQERQMLETCKSTVCQKLSKKCCGVFDEGYERLAILKLFWKSNWDEKKNVCNKYSYYHIN